MNMDIQVLDYNEPCFFWIKVLIVINMIDTKSFLGNSVNF